MLTKVEQIQKLTKELEYAVSKQYWYRALEVSNLIKQVILIEKDKVKELEMSFQDTMKSQIISYGFYN